MCFTITLYSLSIIIIVFSKHFYVYARVQSDQHNIHTHPLSYSFFINASVSQHECAYVLIQHYA